MAYTDQLTSTGLEVMTLEERIAALETAVKNDFGPSLDTRAGSLVGQLIRIFAESEQTVIELAQAVYSGQYPDTATGFSLALISALTGTNKRAATPSTIPSTSGSVNIDPGTLSAGAVAHVDGDPSSRFVLDADVTNGGGVAAWVSAAFTAESTGPTICPSGELVIAEPATGWNDVTNSSDAVIGRLEETDTELRLRRQEELQTGSTAAGAILTEITQTDGVVWAAVIENDTDVTDAYGRPSHSIESVVRAPTLTDLQIATVIYHSKAGGIEAYGSTVEQVTDSHGKDHNIGFTRSTLTDIYVEVTLTYGDDYAGDDAVKLAIAEYGQTELGVGADVLASRIIAVADVEGVVDIDIGDIKIDDVTPPVTTGNFVISWDELASLDTSRITVNSSEA